MSESKIDFQKLSDYNFFIIHKKKIFFNFEKTEMSDMDGCVFGCLNDGRCELFLNRYMCNCRIGYTGDACQVSFGITYKDRWLRCCW